MLDITTPETNTMDITPRIIVIGVGGAGGNAVENMIVQSLEGCEFVTCNTDAQALKNSSADKCIQLGGDLTSGLGAGANPEVGRKAAEESIAEIADYIEGANMVFIAAGMGGGTGTGSAPVIARTAREKGILTVGVVTKPFEFEGIPRSRHAEEGIAELQKYVDTLIVIPNENLHGEISETDTFKDAFKKVDNVLYLGVQGVTDLMIKPGLINLDFNDICTVMSEKGKAMMGVGESKKSVDGSDASLFAAEKAIHNRLLDDDNMRGAKAVIINITASEELTLNDASIAANRVREEVAEDANIIFGTTLDNSMDDIIRVSIVATGISANFINKTTETTFNIEKSNTDIFFNASSNTDEDVSSSFLETSSIKIENELHSSIDTNSHIGESPEVEISEPYAETNKETENSSKMNDNTPPPALDENYYGISYETSENFIDPFLEADMANASEGSSKPVIENVTEEQTKKAGFFKTLFGGIKSSNDDSTLKTEPVIEQQETVSYKSSPVISGNLATDTEEYKDSDMDIPAFLRKQIN